MASIAESTGDRKRKFLTGIPTLAIESGVSSIANGATPVHCMQEVAVAEPSRVHQYCQFPNTRCNPERFLELVRVLTEEQRRWVDQMGFGDLLRLSVKKVDRFLCLWLMGKFDPDRRRLYARENVWVEVDANDVGWVLGLPGPNRPVPQDMPQSRLVDLRLKYKNKKGIDERIVYDTLTSPTIVEDEFKEAFLLYTLGVLLCPTQSCKISPTHLKVLLHAADAANYNWCQYVFEWLILSARKFKVSKSVVGGYGGCALFLMIFYLDRINMGNPINWSTTASRVDAWDSHMCSMVLKKDRKNRHEFGKAKFVRNVSYGRRYPIGSVKERWEEVRVRNRGKCKANPEERPTTSTETARNQDIPSTLV